MRAYPRRFARFSHQAVALVAFYLIVGLSSSAFAASVATTSNISIDTYCVNDSVVRQFTTQTGSGTVSNSALILEAQPYINGTPGGAWVEVARKKAPSGAAAETMWHVMSYKEAASAWVYRAGNKDATNATVYGTGLSSYEGVDWASVCSSEVVKPEAGSSWSTDEAGSVDVNVTNSSLSTSPKVGETWPVSIGSAVEVKGHASWCGSPPCAIEAKVVNAAGSPVPVAEQTPVAGGGGDTAFLTAEESSAVKDTHKAAVSGLTLLAFVGGVVLLFLLPRMTK